MHCVAAFENLRFAGADVLDQHGAPGRIEATVERIDEGDATRLPGGCVNRPVKRPQVARLVAEGFTDSATAAVVLLAPWR
ncbi:MAG: hypothetical protein HYR72_06310 [Deltaproteobacteria bacterium]|nr:hypothetical protein [Deltaproteobacteria bacterium]MBI3387059.1 hypothetical protein [Deltaproteobacteria bacterium]